MSIDAREKICAPGSGVFFQNDPVQRLDLLDPEKTDSNLIALLEWIRQRFFVEITAVRSDHHIDGPTEHNPGGLAFDGWPLKSIVPGDWMDATSPQFQDYLAHVAAFPGIGNIGLAGSAYSVENVTATGLPETMLPELSQVPCCFHDNGDDHIHHKVKPA